MFKKHHIIKFSKDEEIQKGKGFYYKGTEYVHHSDLEHHESALYTLSPSQLIFFSFVAVLLVLGFVFSWKMTLIILIALLTFVYFADLLFNLFLIIRSFAKPPEIEIADEEVKSVDEKTLPSYTIFCPLYKESSVLPQFVKAMNKLDYPKKKLQILLLLEDDDKETINAARAMNLPSHFEITVIPHSVPKTKPKALNYGMLKATGDNIAVFDAEDIPETDQLKKVAIAFSQSDDRVKCIQAKLSFYNPHQKILTCVFTAQYTLWFDLVLTGLQSIHAPIPLGGTSNHFRKKDLHYLKGWDAFNVTEDCDLGMRLVKQGFRTAIVNSTTYEEANSSMSNWLWQRTRWIKGYIQTYLVHMRRPHDFLRHSGVSHMLLHFNLLLEVR